MELAGLTEIAGILGVSRQRSLQLKKNTDFPTPIATLKMGSVWLVSDIQKYKETRNTRNGRPRIGKAPSAPVVAPVAPEQIPGQLSIDSVEPVHVESEL